MKTRKPTREGWTVDMGEGTNGVNIEWHGEKHEDETGKYFDEMAFLRIRAKVINNAGETLARKWRNADI